MLLWLRLETWVVGLNFKRVIYTFENWSRLFKYLFIWFWRMALLWWMTQNSAEIFCGETWKAQQNLSLKQYQVREGTWKWKGGGFLAYTRIQVRSCSWRQWWRALLVCQYLQWRCWVSRMYLKASAPTARSSLNVG